MVINFVKETRRPRVTNFGKEIRKLRLDTGMTQKDMGAKARISMAHLSAIERGRRSLTLPVRNRILSVFPLKFYEKAALKRLAETSNKSININLSLHSEKKRQLIVRFSHRVSGFSATDIRTLHLTLDNLE